MTTNKKPHYVADKSRTRTYGYTVRDVHGLTTYFTGPDCTAGWYRRKYDAQHHADVLNKAMDILIDTVKDVVDES
jgi:hypothetical protein